MASKAFDPTNKPPVVVLTGASGALGSAIASAYSECGATLVLQDIPEAKPALEALAQQLRSTHRNTISTSYINIRTDAPALINFALQTYGYITTLINNAGFLRDSSFAKLGDPQWDDIVDIHLTVPYRLTRSVWPIFNQQKFGRVLFVTSHAGIFGNFGQSNYSAAKGAVMALTKTLALEGKKNGILVNAIAPFAMSKMTESAFPKEMLTSFSPQEIAPVVLFLTDRDSNVTGEVLQCGGGWVARTVVYTTPGVVFKTGDAATAPVQSKLTQFKQAWPQLNQDPVVAEFQANSDSDSQARGIFAKTADQVLAEMMRLVRHSQENLHGAGTISTSPVVKLAQNAPQGQNPSSKSSVASVPAVAPSGLKAEALFGALGPHIDASIVKATNVVLGFDVIPGSPQPRNSGSAAPAAAVVKRSVTIDLKNGKGGVVWDKLQALDGSKPDATLIIHDDLLAKLFLQEVDAQSLFVTGKIKVKGDIAKALKFEQVLKLFEKKVSIKDMITKAQARL